jgi:hypothetical protein
LSLELEATMRAGDTNEAIQMLDLLLEFSLLSRARLRG